MTYIICTLYKCMSSTKPVVVVIVLVKRESILTGQYYTYYIIYSIYKFYNYIIE